MAVKKAEITKNKVVKAARNCFRKYGYEKTTLDDIGKAAQMNKASLYYHFKNKQELFIQVALEDSEHEIRAIQNKAEARPTFESAVLFYIDERFEYYQQVLRQNYLSLETVAILEPEFDKQYQNTLEQEIQFVKSLLEKGMHQEEFQSHDAYQVATVLIYATDAIKHEAMRNNGISSLEELDYGKIKHQAGMLVQLVLNGLK